MTPVTFDIQYIEERNRLSSALRMFWALPHLIILYFLTAVAEIIAVLQWFFILFRGKREEGLFRFTAGILDWYLRGYAYADLMYDEYPNFGFARRNEPTAIDIPYDEPANRLTNGLRLIWAIPALLIGLVLGIALFAVTIASWFAILFTGKHPAGMFGFMMKVHRFMAQLMAYIWLLTDVYPRFDSGAATTEVRLAQ